jgi:hypothetical protein
MTEGGRFSGQAEIKRAVITYEDGAQQQFDATGAAAVRLTPAEGTFAISLAQILKYYFDRHGGLMRMVGDRVLATAAQFGVAYAQTSIVVPFDEPIEDIPRDHKKRTVVSVTIDYAITARLLDDKQR